MRRILDTMRLGAQSTGTLIVGGLVLTAGLGAAPIGDGDGPLTDDERSKIEYALDQVFATAETVATEDAGYADKGYGDKWGKKMSKEEAAGYASWEASTKLGEFVAKKPEAWGLIEPRLREAMSATCEVCDCDVATHHKALGLMVQTYDDRALEMGAEYLVSQPESFSANHILAFAERNAEPFVESVRASAMESCESGGCVRPAAFLALRGDDSAKKALFVTLKKGDCNSPMGVGQALLAGQALESLGIEGSCHKAQLRAHEAVLAALDADRFEEAREMALVAGFFAERLNKAEEVALKAKSYGKKPGAPSVAWIGEEVDGYVGKMAQKFENSDQVFELIERITPL